MKGQQECRLIYFASKIGYANVMAMGSDSQKRDIKVSILCLTYNQKDYIVQALDSFLMQETDFKFEVLINDDASTDGTREIVEQYAAKYPDMFLPVFHDENQYSLGKRNFMVRYLMPRVRGKYIAVCEGDDYWTDSSKLQRQADFLDSHPDYSLCFHPIKVFFEKGNEESYIFPAERIDKPSVTKLLQGNYIQTNSVMYRKQQYSSYNLEVVPGDYYLHVYHAKFGKIGCIDRVMAAYRRHEGGMWWNSHADPDEIWRKFGLGHLALYQEMLLLHGTTKVRRDAVYASVANVLDALHRIDVKHDEGLIEQAFMQFPHFLPVYMKQKTLEVARLGEAVKAHQTTIDELRSDLATLDKKLLYRINEVDQIRNSRLWRMRGMASQFVRH